MQFERTKKFIISKLKKELAKHLSYHSVNHINDVYSAAENLAKHEGITGEDLTLLLTAVLFHDSGFLIQQKGHESISCEIAKLYLPDFGYTHDQVERICGMIMATCIPQTPHNLLEEIICDADLDYLGRDDFFTIGNNLYAELQVYGMINNEDEWNNMQVGFLKKHHYFTATAIKLRKAKKDQHLKQVRLMLKK
jgi:predicted metal-dependent HD superfamily phosphohydrolase